MKWKYELSSLNNNNFSVSVCVIKLDSFAIFRLMILLLLYVVFIIL